MLLKLFGGHVEDLLQETKKDVFEGSAPLSVHIFSSVFKLLDGFEVSRGDDSLSSLLHLWVRCDVSLEVVEHLLAQVFLGHLLEISSRGLRSSASVFLFIFLLTTFSARLSVSI